MDPDAASPSRARATVKDVAALAGVSPKTVSNVVNDLVPVTPATRARVEDAVAQLGYRPNVSARNLRRGRTGMVALAVPELDVPYFGELARHFLTAAQERDCTVIVEQTLGDEERERAVVEGFGAAMVDGIVFSPLALTGAQLSGAGSTPLVLLGEHPSDGLLDHVGIDNVAAARAAVAHLVALGRRRIAVLGARSGQDVGTASLRLAGYHEALADAGLPADPALVECAGSYHRREGAEAARRLLDRCGAQPPDAVFCCNDTLAMGALYVLHERGLRVPEDVAVIGFDGTDEADFSIPRLSTVAPDMNGIAQTALRLLFDRIEERPAEVREIVAGYELRVRESTRPAGQDGSA